MVEVHYISTLKLTKKWSDIVKKRRSHSKIDRLPLAVRNEVEKRLIKGDTYLQISQYLNESGYTISLSCVHRFGKPFLEAYEKIKRSKEMARMISRN